jgi:hypothetical protein
MFLGGAVRNSIELFEAIVGLNEQGKICHPFKGLKGDKKGLFSITFSADNTTFRGVTEQELRTLVISGAFNDAGRIRMIPKGADSTSGAGALHPVSYQGSKLPL